MKKILVTGAAGFIGHHIIESLLKNTDYEIITLDRLSVSGNLNRYSDIEIWNQESHRVKILHHDLRSPVNDWLKYEIGYVDYILHMAASTHVDRSITDPMSFVLDNVVATTNILEFAKTGLRMNVVGEGENMKKYRSGLFIYFSTDEVFGPAAEGVAYGEWARYNSGNPYSAAKAGGEEMALAYANTYRIPTIVTHTMNVFGERQHPEKFIPLVINKVLKGETITIHSNKDKTKAGSRFWIHARNVASAIIFLMDRFEKSEIDADGRKQMLNPHWADKFNIVGEMEVDNLQMAQFIYETVKDITHPNTPVPIEVPHEMVDFHSSRPGHDLRYALDGTKMKEMGWNLPVSFTESLKEVIKWTINNPKWLK